MTFRSALIPVLLLFSFHLSAQAPEIWKTPFEKDDNQTAEFPEVVEYFQQMAKSYSSLEYQEWGQTDAGHPLPFVILSPSGVFDPEQLRAENKLVLFINNAIHPGEPCGVDATMMLIRDYLTGTLQDGFPEDLVLITIPYYNVGGGLNRSATFRANQNGPSSQGFRGNSKNLDLNRDFIKCDSRNAQTFNQIISHWQPDIVVDTHTSNGADYTYTMTLIPTQPDKLAPSLSVYMQDQLLPDLYQRMAKRNWEMCPYVYARGTPDKGIFGFLDSPRYSTGYTSLHHAIGFTTEAHMLKPFADRVQSTYVFLEELIQLADRDRKSILEARARARQASARQKVFPIDWTIDQDNPDTILFKGFTAGYKPSRVHGMERLYYDQSAPYEKPIPYFSRYYATDSVEAPIAYIIPQAYQEVIDRLQWNGVKMDTLKEKKTLEVEMYYIEDYGTTESAYEGHYLHYNVALRKELQKQTYYPGDRVVYVNQPTNRHIVETLEPQAPDSYFCWNFFDGILMQKEYFSAYVFEDFAATFLQSQPELQAELEKRKKEDEEFAKSARAQLDFIYRNSPYYEPTHNRYPVGRLVNDKL
jgi:hypothetical protein